MAFKIDGVHKIGSFSSNFHNLAVFFHFIEILLEKCQISSINLSKMIEKVVFSYIHHFIYLFPTSYKEIIQIERIPRT